VPEGWERKTLGEVVENFDRKRVPLSVLEREHRRGPYPYYGAADILDHIDGYLFDGRYLLMGEDGTVITERGTPMLQLVEGKFWVNNHAHILHGTVLSTEHIFCALSEYQIQGHVTGVAQPKITQKNMNRIPMLVPSPSLRRGFQDVVLPFIDQRLGLLTQNDLLRKARDLLLPRLMNGDIAV
jgi:type I restriction enzyme S subunit